MTVLVEVEPTRRCDRCGHRSNQHAMPVNWSVCTVKERDGKRCPCDGYFPVPK